MSIPAEAFVLPPAGRGSLQQRIRQMVTEGILAGRFRAGQRMPSSRGLAEHLGISRITVTLSYAELVSSDYLTARGRSGYFVSENAPRAPEMPARGPRAESPDFARLMAGRVLGAAQVERPADWESYAYSFIYGQADPTLFDHQNWRLCAVRALGRRDFGALTQDYYDRDDPLLIEHVLRSILPRRGIAAEPEEVLLTLGAQNALWIAAQVLLGPGRRAAVENRAIPGSAACWSRPEPRFCRWMSMPRACRPRPFRVGWMWSSPPPATSARPMPPCRWSGGWHFWKRRGGRAS